MKRHILIAALALGLTAPALAQGAIPQPIYFWGNVVAYIEAPGQPAELPAVRPSVISLTEDGSAVIEHLQWTGWGSSVTHATGISSASNGIPNMAQGKRITKPAQVTLSNPGLFQGREVYRCFTLTVPPAATSEPSCLTEHGGYWSLSGTSPKGSTAPPTTTTEASSGTFFSPIPGLSLNCGLVGSASHGVGVSVYCQTINPPRSVMMGSDGQFKVCSGGTITTTHCIGNPGINTRALAYGRQITVGPFRCQSEQVGVTCTVIQTGKGFLISKVGITAVGQAGVTPVSPSGQGLTPKKEAVMFSPLAYGLSCNMTDDGSVGGSWVYCWIGGSPDPTHHVKLDLDGQFSLTATTAIPLGLGGRSTPYGGEVTVGHFRCQSLRSGIKCTVVTTGKGFLFNMNGATPVA